MIIAAIILAIIATEATTEILVESNIFAPLRSKIASKAYPEDPQKLSNSWLFINSLINCGYCLSVWVSFFYVIILNVVQPLGLPVSLLLVFSIHRLSNWMHIAFQVFKYGRVKSYEVEWRRENGRTGESEGQG